MACYSMCSLGKPHKGISLKHPDDLQLSFLMLCPVENVFANFPFDFTSWVHFFKWCR